MNHERVERRRLSGTDGSLPPGGRASERERRCLLRCKLAHEALRSGPGSRRTRSRDFQDVRRRTRSRPQRHAAVEPVSLNYTSQADLWTEGKGRCEKGKVALSERRETALTYWARAHRRTPLPSWGGGTRPGTRTRVAEADKSRFACSASPTVPRAGGSPASGRPGCGVAQLRSPRIGGLSIDRASRSHTGRGSHGAGPRAGRGGGGASVHMPPSRAQSNQLVPSEPHNKIVRSDDHLSILPEWLTLHLPLTATAFTRLPRLGRQQSVF